MISLTARRHDTFRFADRRAAGKLLGQAVAALRIPAPVTVLGLPRGGVPVAFEVANALDAPLDVLAVRKIGMPGQPELAIGAIAIGGVIVHEARATPFLGTVRPSFPELAAAERRELRRRDNLYRHGLPPIDVAGRNVVLVDDGLATGATMVAAIRAARRLGAASVIAAAPVAGPEAAQRVAVEADQVAILETPEILFAVGEWYHEYPQLEDMEVCGLLTRAARRHPFTAPSPHT
ncbi:MAG TPA: phosphoribosyltransferase family protein [Steroidobacteraceae bacterium]|nr:phosphoribosyltransferase family protein [Steroidobacteraceae bacterium]